MFHDTSNHGEYIANLGGIGGLLMPFRKHVGGWDESDQCKRFVSVFYLKMAQFAQFPANPCICRPATVLR
jgi:hypothetical protein